MLTPHPILSGILAKAGLISPLLLVWATAGLAEDAASAPGNRLRNGGFELGVMYNGAPLRTGCEFIYTHQAKRGEKTALTDLAGWWAEGSDREGLVVSEATAHGGRRGLSLKPAADRPLKLLSAPPARVPAGELTFSAWVKTAGAQAVFEIELVKSGTPDSQPPAVVKTERLPLPETADWTRISRQLAAAADQAAQVRLVVKSGEVGLDEVQLEPGTAPTEFNLKPAEWLELELSGEPDEQLPVWGEAAELNRELIVRNASTQPLAGILEVWLGPWNQPKQMKVEEQPGFSLAPAATHSTTLKLGGLASNAYVVTTVYRPAAGTPVDSQSAYQPELLIAGAHSNGLAGTRGVARFVLAPVVEPQRIFGVGNGMLGYGWRGVEGGWSGGWPLALYDFARPERFVCARGRYAAEDVGYLLGAAGLVTHRMESQNAFMGAPAEAAFANPATKGGIDLWNPEGWRFFLERAEAVGRENGRNPLIASYQMANETPFPFKDGLCPTVAADAAFRDWCRERHGELETLNRRWHTAYKDWTEVEQPASARYAAEVMARPELKGAAAVDWTASLGQMTPEIMNRMQQSPGRALDWYRWRTASSLRAYTAFREAARKNDSKTLYSTNLCWPDFWPQLSLPFFRAMDATMLDCQYTSGLPRGLGTPQEMLEIVEMFEANAPDKPLWGIEIYVQPQWPAGFTSLQNWGLVAHGMSNNLVFAWGPYSDHGIPKTEHAWEEPKAHPMWLMIDKDGTKLPAYHANQKSAKEIRAFHEKFDALSLRRAASDTGFYVSADTAEYIGYSTGNKPWGSPWTRTRNNLIYILRMSGVALDFADDETLAAKLAGWKRVVVPASRVLSQDAAEKLADFARRGGTLILAGASGLTDPWLEPYENLGGPAWRELDWRAPKFSEDFSAAKFYRAEAKPAGEGDPGDYMKGPTEGLDESKTFRGGEFGELAQAEPIRDASGLTVGWQRAWGQGRIVAYGVFPDVYSGNPHLSLNQAAWARQLIAQAQIPTDCRWTAFAPVAASAGGKHGEGTPVVEVVLRNRLGQEDNEKFVFVLNQGGAGEGKVEVRLPAGNWTATDAISGQAVAAPNAEGLWSLPLKLEPWEYRVFRLARE